MTYTVKQAPDKQHWIVVNELGEVANDFKHTTETAAKKHCRNLNAHFGGDNG